ncbi:MAG TPA: hypothetical protein VHG09_01625, partial [Longimicrobiales bacterium]|nr:hypothetical protein [Longimicrobiales bacterium]
CFPGAELEPHDDPAQRAMQVAGTHAITAAPTGSLPQALGVIEHVFSHRRERYHCYILESTTPVTVAPGTAWIGEDDTARALPRAQQRIRAMALARGDLSAHSD